MSKLLLISDLHIRENTPVGRIDNFQESMWKKLRFIFETAYENEVDAILQAGDFFDKPNPSYLLVNQFINFWRMFPIPIYSVCGQHDLYMRNTDINRTAFGLLENAGLITDNGRTKPQMIIENNQEGRIYLYGCQYGEEIEDWGARADEFSVLIIHAMIGDKPLYPGQELTEAGRFLVEYPEYQIILCGDYHYPFHIRRGNRHIVNTGCMLRMTRDERDMNRIPHFYIVDTEKNEWRKCEIPCEYADLDKVFASKKDIPDKIITDEDDLLRFIEQLKQKGKSGIHYMSVLEDYCKENKISGDVLKLITDALIE